MAAGIVELGKLPIKFGWDPLRVNERAGLRARGRGHRSEYKSNPDPSQVEVFRIHIMNANCILALRNLILRTDDRIFRTGSYFGTGVCIDGRRKGRTYFRLGNSFLFPFIIEENMVRIVKRVNI